MKNAIYHLIKPSFLLTITLLFNLMQSKAQTNIAIGEWRSHFSTNQTSLLELGNNKIYAVAQYGLISFNTQSLTSKRISKIQGLSHVEISAIKYDEVTNSLMIGYSNGVMDVIQENGISTYDLRRNNQLSNNNRINHIFLEGDQIFISTDNGLLVVNKMTQKITNAYINLGAAGESIQIYNMTKMDNKIYLATSETILSADTDTGLLLEDYSNWTRHELPAINNINLVAVMKLNDTAIAISEKQIFQLVNEDWNEIASIDLTENEKIIKTRKTTNHIIIITNRNTYRLDTAFNSETIELEGHVATDIIEIESNNYLISTIAHGLLQITNGITNIPNIVSGPVTDEIHKIKYLNDEIIAFPKINTKDPSLSNELGYSSFVNGTWNTTKPNDIGLLDNITDIEDIGESRYVSSYSKGIYDIRTAQKWDSNNSNLTTDANQNIRVTSLSKDINNNLVIATKDNPYLIYKTNTNEWGQYNFDNSNEPTDIIINDINQVWIKLEKDDKGQGVLVHDINQNTSRIYSSANTSLPSNEINDWTLSSNQELWLATNKGPGYLPLNYDAANDNTIDIAKPIFEQQYLFHDEKTNSIAIDEGNRKWFGTENGLWLFDAKIENIIYHFTIENSPLPSNNIVDIAINNKSGEVFILTDKGMVSYRNDAIERIEEHNNVQIFPNPVRPNFDGKVGLIGLAENSTIKITTISGRHVAQFKSQGSAASWDLKNNSNDRVNAGVYLVFSSREDGNDTFIGKIAIQD